MNPLLLQYRKLRRKVLDARRYLSFDPGGNEIPRRTDFSNCQRPVLLLYGFLSTRRTFDILERRLRREGYCVWSIAASSTARCSVRGWRAGRGSERPGAGTNAPAAVEEPTPLGRLDTGRVTGVHIRK